MSSAAFIGTGLDEEGITSAFNALADEPKAEMLQTARKAVISAREFVQGSPLFELAPGAPGGDDAVWFRPTGHGVYGYTVEEIKRDLRIDIDQVTSDFVDAVNAATDVPKAFLCHASIGPDGGLYAVHSALGGSDTLADELGGNPDVVDREARSVLAYAFRNVTVCKCGI